MFGYFDNGLSSFPTFLIDFLFSTVQRMVSSAIVASDRELAQFYKKRAQLSESEMQEIFTLFASKVYSQNLLLSFS